MADLASEVWLDEVVLLLLLHLRSPENEIRDSADYESGMIGGAEAVLYISLKMDLGERSC